MQHLENLKESTRFDKAPWRRLGRAGGAGSGTCQLIPSPLPLPATFRRNANLIANPFTKLEFPRAPRSYRIALIKTVVLLLPPSSNRINRDSCAACHISFALVDEITTANLFAGVPYALTPFVRN